jgi:hypothetical protein
MGEYKGKPVNSIVFLVLGLVTCGLLWIYWIYLIINDVNKSVGKEVVSLPMFIVGLLCFPVGWYNIYQIAQNWNAVRKANGQPEKDDAMILTILGILILPVALFMMQEELNKMWGGTPGTPGIPGTPQ